MLFLRLLGPFELAGEGGHSVLPDARKDRALLAYLALLGEPVDRARLAELLWPDRSEGQARKSLRQSLVTLRRTLNGNGCVLPADRRRTVAIDLDGIDVDVRRFERLGASDSLESVREAVSLRRGRLLHDLDLPDTPFQQWLDAERLRLDEQACRLLERLCGDRIARREWSDACAAARRILAVDPLHEAGHHLLMRSLHGRGERSEALRQYHQLEALLREELDTRPADETVRLYRAIKDGGEYAVTPTGAPEADDTRAPRVPGLVVLPLRRLPAPAADQDWLAVGLFEELVAALAPYRWFYVISALKALTYRHKAVAPEDLARELGVRYVLEGTLRELRDGITLRLSLSETSRGEQLWTETVHCRADDVFEEQTRLARKVASLVEPEVLRHEARLVERVPPADVEAWKLAVRARCLAYQGTLASLEESLNEAVELAREAIRRAPQNALGHAVLAWTLYYRFVTQGRDDRVLHESIDACDRAIALDSGDYLAHMVRGATHLRLDDYDTSEQCLRRSIALNPSFPVAYNHLMHCLTRAGRAPEAQAFVAEMDRISPDDPFSGYYACIRAQTCYFLNDDRACVDHARLSLQLHSTWFISELLLVAAQQRLGWTAEARRDAERLVAKRGILTSAFLRRRAPLRLERDRLALERPLRAAGVVVD